MHTLRGSLRIDGWGTGVAGLVMLAGGPWLSGPLGLPSGWFAPVGIVLLGGAVALLVIAARPQIPPVPVGIAIVGNALSGAAILLALGSGLVPLTGWGVAVLFAGAGWTGAFPVLTWRGARVVFPLCGVRVKPLPPRRFRPAPGPRR